MVYLRHEVRVGGKELLGRLSALPEALGVIGEPGARLVDDVVLDGHVQKRALLGDALSVHDVELGLLEGRGDLVLDDLDADAVADVLAVDLDAVDATDVHADGREELEGATARRSLGVAEHDADLLAQLVDEDAGGV